MKLVSIQNQIVLRILQDWKPYFARPTKTSNLVSPYKAMMDYYGWQDTPIFGCVEGKRSEFYGANFEEDSVALILEVPDNEVKLQCYYWWTDLIYFMEHPDEWGDQPDSLSEYSEKTLLSGVHANEPNVVVQATIPYILPEWLVDYKESKYFEKYNGSGGRNVLQIH